MGLNTIPEQKHDRKYYLDLIDRIKENNPLSYYTDDFSMTAGVSLEYLRKCNYYDFYIIEHTSAIYLYFRVYNSNGNFIDNKLWGIFNSYGDLLDLIHNLILNKKSLDDAQC